MGAPCHHIMGKWGHQGQTEEIGGMFGGHSDRHDGMFDMLSQQSRLMRLGM